MRILHLIAPLALLTACGALPPPVPDGPALPPIAQDTCNANQYSGLIGQDATALEDVLIMRQVRVIRPSQAVTMDFRPERINFNIGADNRIISINCS